MSKTLEKFERDQRVLAEAKIREELRNAVSSEMFRRGLTRVDIDKAVQAAVERMVVERVNVVLKDSHLQQIIEKQIDKAIHSALDGAGGTKTVKTIILEEVRGQAAKFVSDRVRIDVLGEEFGSF